jgi:hypothetical protein
VYRKVPPVVVALFVAFLPTLAAARDDSGRPGIRTTEPYIANLVEIGVKQSPSFRALVEQLDRTDVVVYVRRVQLAPQHSGQLTFLSAVGGLRYVMVRLAFDRPVREKLATLGHELQHALEIAARADIVDADSLASALEEFGIEQGGYGGIGRSFETAAAREVGIRIRKEVSGALTLAEE